MQVLKFTLKFVVKLTVFVVGGIVLVAALFAVAYLVGRGFMAVVEISTAIAGDSVYGGLFSIAVIVGTIIGGATFFLREAYKPKVRVHGGEDGP